MYPCGHFVIKGLQGRGFAACGGVFIGVGDVFDVRVIIRREKVIPACRNQFQAVSLRMRGIDAVPLIYEGSEELGGGEVGDERQQPQEFFIVGLRLRYF